MKKPHKDKWGNSVLIINIKYWKCFYCGNLIKDAARFSIIRINGDSQAQVFCSADCLKIYTIKMEVTRTE